MKVIPREKVGGYSLASLVLAISAFAGVLAFLAPLAANWDSSNWAPGDVLGGCIIGLVFGSILGIMIGSCHLRTLRGLRIGFAVGAVVGISVTPLFIVVSEQPWTAARLATTVSAIVLVSGFVLRSAQRDPACHESAYKEFKNHYFDNIPKAEVVQTDDQG